MIEAVTLEASKLKIAKPLGIIVQEWLLRIPWALGWLVGFIVHLVKMTVAAVVLGYRTGRG